MTSEIVEKSTFQLGNNLQKSLFKIIEWKKNDRRGQTSGHILI